MSVRIAAPAKVNLVLRVYGGDDSGYHALRTLFCSLELADEVRVTGRLHTPGIDVVVEGAHLGPPESNLAYRAAEAFIESAGTPQGVHVNLVKRIPAGGGLGGGSSDAAAVLRALDETYPDFLTPGVLMERAASLGADVPFFLLREPLSWGEGRGEQLTPLRPFASRPVVLAVPTFPVSTGEAYGWLDRARADGRAETPRSPDRPPRRPLSWEGLAPFAVNDFEAVVFPRYPRLRAARDTLLEHGAGISLLAGTGSTVFGIFQSGAAAEAAAEALQRGDPSLRILHTRTAAR